MTNNDGPDDFWKGTALESVETMKAASAHPLYATTEQQHQLAEAIADLCDNAMHLEACYVTPDETECVCLIGKLRATLPECEYTELRNWAWNETEILTESRRCLRTVHPTAYWKHVFGEA